MSYEKDQFGGVGGGEGSVSVSSMITTRLAPYLTSASLVTALGPYITSASVATAIAPLLTSASLVTALGAYVTSTSLATALGAYLTSASAATALATYITSNSASIALAAKQPNFSVADEGVTLSTVAGTVTTINFVGTGISASLTGGLLTVTSVAGSGSGEGSVSISTMITTALAPYLTSASAATALATYITSNSLSAAVTSNIITSRGSVNASATGSFGALTVAGASWGRPGIDRLGTATTAGLAGVIKVSGTWTNYHTLEIHYQGKGNTTTTNIVLTLYTDGGTTPFLTYPLAANASATASEFLSHITVLGSNNNNVKLAVPRINYTRGIATQATQTNSATITTGAVNCIGICTGNGGLTTTQSAATVYVYGWRI